MRRHLARAATAAVLLATAFTARAAMTLGGEHERWPTEITRRPLTLEQGMIEAWVPVQSNVSEGADGKPVTVNPSVNLGLTDQWQLGVRSFVGLCLGGVSNGCGNVYNDVSVVTRLSVVRGAGLDVALQGALNVAPLQNPRTWGADAGVLVRAGGGALALTVAPTVGFGLADRDRATRTEPIAFNLSTYDVVTPEATTGNKEQLSIPATLSLQLGPMLAVAVAAALDGPLNPTVGSFGDYYRIPAAAILVVTPVRYLDIGASFTYPRFAGKGDTRDIRQLAGFLALRI